MDIFTFIIIVSILGVIGQVLFWGAIILGIAKLTGKIAKSAEEFKNMPREKQLETLIMLQKYRQMSQLNSYMSSVPGPVETEIRSMAAREGIDLKF